MLKVSRNKKGKGQAGFVVTAELLLITVILVLGLVTGMTKLRDQTIAELSDTGDAIGAIDQSYTILGTEWGVGTEQVAATSGFTFLDAPDSQNGLNSAVGGDLQKIVYGATNAPSQLEVKTW